MDKNKQLVFPVNFGCHEDFKQTAYVENGEVVKVHRVEYYYLHNDISIHTCHKGDDSFEYELKLFINNLYKKNQQDYEKFVESLNREFLNKYFKVSYIPKD